MGIFKNPTFCRFWATPKRSQERCRTTENPPQDSPQNPPRKFRREISAAIFPPRNFRREIFRREIRRKIRRKICRPRTLAYPKRRLASFLLCQFLVQSEDAVSAAQSDSETERTKEAPAERRCRLRKILLRPHHSSKVWGPTMCLNVEERFQRNDCCVGVGLLEQFREVGMPALLKGGLGGVARSFATGALGTL